MVIERRRRCHAASRYEEVGSRVCCYERTRAIIKESNSREGSGKRSNRTKGAIAVDSGRDRGSHSIISADVCIWLWKNVIYQIDCGIAWYVDEGGIKKWRMTWNYPFTTGYRICDI